MLPDQPIPFEAVGSDGETLRIAVRPDDGVDAGARARSCANPRRARTGPRRRVAATTSGCSTDGVLYLSLDDMDDVPGETFEALTREVFAALEPAGARRLVVDLRRNGGGNNFFGEALRKGIGRSHVNRPGGLYVLIGPQTFSAAQNLANRLERETFATFVGEPTGGAPNHYGDARIQAGAVTGLTAMVSSLPWFDSYPQDRRPWILPDLPVPETGEDWRAGRDAALAAAIDHRTRAAPDELSPDRVFYFGRGSQQSGWNPFWRA